MQTRTAHARSAAALALALLAAPLAGGARAEGFMGDYSLTYLGVPIARASFNTAVAGGRYAVEGTVASAGLGRIFDDTKGTISASGSLAGKDAVPDRFRTDYVAAKKAQTTEIHFSKGDVARTVNEPPLKQTPWDWVPLREADLRSVVDPLTATIVRASKPEEVCGRTVRLYEGQLRADLKLTDAGRGTISTEGYKGETVVCRLAFAPVSGYRPSRSALKFLRDKSQMTVAFAPLGKTGLYAPVQASVGSPIGTLTITARRFQQVN